MCYEQNTEVDSFLYGYQVIQGPFDEKKPFFPLSYPGMFVENCWVIYYFWTLNSVSLMFMFSLTLISHAVIIVL